METSYNRIGARSVPMVRLYRSAALTAGADGALTSLPWDAESSLVTRIGYDHSTVTEPEKVTVRLPGLHALDAVVRFAAALLLTAVQLEIQVDTGGGFAAVAKATLPATGTALVVSGVTTIQARAAVDLLEGAVVRVQFAGVGTANAPLVVGDGVTYFSAHLV